MGTILKRTTLIVRDDGSPLRMTTCSFWGPDGYFFELNQRHPS